MRWFGLAVCGALVVAGCSQVGSEVREFTLPAGERYEWPNGSWVSAGPLESTRVVDVDSGEGPGLCSLMRFENGAAQVWEIDTTDFAVGFPDRQRGSGAGVTPVDGGELAPTSLPPGGEVAGLLCVKDPGQRGRFQVILEGEGGELVWDSPVS